MGLLQDKRICLIFATWFWFSCAPQKPEPIKSPQPGERQQLQQGADPNGEQEEKSPGLEEPSGQSGDPDLPAGFLQQSDLKAPTDLEKYDPDRVLSILNGLSLVYRQRPTDLDGEDTRPVTACFASEAKASQATVEKDAAVFRFEQTTASCKLKDFEIKNLQYKTFIAYSCGDQEMAAIEGTSLFDYIAKGGSDFCAESSSYQVLKQTEMSGTMSYETAIGGIGSGESDTKEVTYRFKVRSSFGGDDGAYCVMANQDSGDVYIESCLEVAITEHSDHQGPEWTQTKNAIEQANFAKVLSDRKSDYYIDGKIELKLNNWNGTLKYVENQKPSYNLKASGFKTVTGRHGRD